MTRPNQHSTRRGVFLAPFLAVAACLGEVSSQEVHTDNIVVILDASGSMKQAMRGTRTSKMEAAKRALLEVLSHIREGTHVGLLVFSASNMETGWAYPIGPADRARLEEAVRRPQPGSGTPLGAFLKKGADALLEKRGAQKGYGSYRLLVVTDGQASDPGLVERYLPDILSRGITVDVIGVDMDEDHSLATRVHSYRRASDPRALAQAVQEVFAEISSPRDDLTDQETFELLGPIPETMAVAMLEALTNSGNQPIGEKPREVESGGDTAASRRSVPPGPPPPPRPEPPRDGLWDRPGWVVKIFVAVIAVYVLRRLFRGQRRRR